MDGADPAEDDGGVSGRMLVADVADERVSASASTGMPSIGSVRKPAKRSPGEPHRELAVLVPEDVHREGAPLARRRPCP
jgi:hypothetical protein